MTKTLLYVVILAVLGIGVYYFLFGNHNTFDTNEAGFSITDTTAIGKIFIADNSGKSVTVERAGNGWIVNKKYKALKGITHMLLKTLSQQEALYPVPKQAHNDVIKNLASTGIKVEVYDREGKKMRSFFVGSETNDFHGTNMLIEGAGKPYVVNVPGFPGYLTPRYSTDIADWRDRTVFDMEADSIKKISVDYFGKPINSFSIMQDQGKITVAGDPNIAKGEANMRRAGVYLKYFKNINCEGYLNGKNDMDSTIRTAPKRATIDITGAHGEHQRADIYWMAANKRSKNLTTHSTDVPDEYDADRYYAVINDNRDTVLIQQYTFGKLFRLGYEFFEKDLPAQPVNERNEKQPTNVIMHKP